MIHLRMLGGLDLRNSEGQELRAVLAQPKRAALLAYLALASPRGTHRRDSLLALFWPEQDAEHARNALSQAVHFLRRSVGTESIIAGNGDGLALDRTGLCCDAVAFEEALDAGRPDDALELYHGDLLEGFHIAEAVEFERWLETERARLAERYGKALQCVAKAREAAGDWGEAVRLWRRLASRDPYNSQIAACLMRALAVGGDPGGAVQHARVHETLLREELDVAPDPEVAGLVRQLQSAPTEQSPGQGLERPVLGPPKRTLGPKSERVVPTRKTPLIAAALVVLLTAGAGAFALRNGASEQAIPAIRSLAVLPVENLSSDSSDEFFADGIHDALITELARYPQLKVISRTSVMQYRGTKKSLPAIARELRVDGVVEGTLLRDGGHVRMNAQLVHGPTDRHLWAKRYQRDLQDILVLQAELAEAIAREVRVATAPMRSSLGRGGGPPDSAPQALYLKELYLRGRHAEINRSPMGVETAKQYYDEVIERDSNFALGYAGLAGLYSIMAEYDLAPNGPALDTAEVLARRAVALDSTLPGTRAALALALANKRNFQAAEREFQRAIELGPSDARAHFWYSILLVALGRGEQALLQARRAMELDPFGPNPQIGMVRYATWLSTGQRPHLKLPVAERRPALKVEPGDPWARAQEAYDYAEEGQCAEADKSLSRAQPLAPKSFRMLAYVATVDWLCGRKIRARTLLEKMKERTDMRDHGYRIALVHAAFGEKDSAFIWLPRTRWTLGQLSSLSAERRMDPLRSDPRFLALLRELGVR
jgi:DNA-binding SARP family transcriptional activator/TolB-like protein/Flp pilus assembly protein TadD